MSRISDAQIEQIAAANDIVEVISSYFPLKRAGTAWTALCPFHQERSPSFRVNPQRQMFKCFGCGAGGSVYRFVQDYEHIDFPSAVRKLAERAGIRIEEQEMSAEDYAKVGLRKRLLALHAAAADWFHARLMKGQAGDTARQYLKSRGINADIARSWKIGYAPESWDGLMNWAQREGYNMETLTASGLITTREPDEDRRQARTYDRFRHRVMFPICNDLGEVIAFSGRTLEANPKAAKYVNSPETPLFNKGSVLFGLHKTKRALIDKQSAIVCEGQLDLITAFEAGVQNCIAPQGTAFTDKQARILKRYVEEVVLCFDADPAGEKAAERSLASLLAEGLSVRLASMPPGEDPDSLIRTQGADAFMARIKGAKDFFDFQLDRLAAAPDFQSPRGRANAARKLANWTALVTDPLLRDGIVNKVSVRLTMPVKDFTKAVANAKPRESKGDDAPAEPVREMPKLTDSTLLLLAQVALQSADARQWLQGGPWRDLLERESESLFVMKILSGDFDPEQESSVRVFLTTLEPHEEALASELLTRPAPRNALEIARDCWDALARRQVLRHLDELEARFRDPSLPIQEMLAVGKEIQELREEHKGLLRPETALRVSPPSVA